MARGAIAQAPPDTATATLSDSGIVVRFPRSMSPDSITREMPVLDLFSGYEWRVALLAGDQALLAALVVPPDDSLVLHRYTTIKSVYMAGDLRQCQREAMVLGCGSAARGLVRDVDGRVEIAMVDNRWLIVALETPHPIVRLVVKRNRTVLWTRDLPLVVH